MKIILTGGGTAGHVNPNLALIPYLQAEDFEIEYIGSIDGMEKDLVKQKKIPYHGISSGKLRRYFDIKNFTDIGNVFKGILQSKNLMKKLKPNIIFSKGGFVTVPVVFAGWLHRIPVVIHESDITMGLANKISSIFASVVCTSFSQTAKHMKKAIVTGPPIRNELFNASARRAKKILNFNDNPVILIMGGSQGSIKINETVIQILDKLSNFNIIHICGKGNSQNIKRKNYIQYEYVTDKLADFFALADIIVSRSGSNSIFEFLALRKPNLLIPLPKKSSRGDQILNAKLFEKEGFSKVLPEEKLNAESLFENIIALMSERDIYIKNMEKFNFENGSLKIIDQIKKYARN